LAAAYGIGFVVVNIHLARYAGPANDLLKARYLAAGLTYVLVLGIPAVSAAIGWALAMHTHKERSASDGEQWTWRSRSRAAWIILLTQISTFFVWRFQLLGSITIRRDFWAEVMLFAIATTWGINGVWIFGDYIREFREKRTTPSWWNSLLSQTLFAIGALLSSIASFAKGVYPNIAPQFGGGAVPVVRVRLGPSADSSLGRHLRFPAALIEHTGELTFLVTCDSSAASGPQSLALASNDISALEFIAGDSTTSRPERENAIIALDHDVCSELRTLRVKLPASLESDGSLPH
jgi:hypothetical protein